MKISFFLLFTVLPIFALETCDNPVDRLETKDIPVLDTENSGFLQANVLTFVISSRLVNERADATIVLSDSQLDCNYPGPHWTRSQQGEPDCTETWTAQLPWSVARQCNLTRLETQEEIIFTGEIVVQQEETLDVVRGTALTRDLSTGFLYELTFPKAVELSSGSIRTFAPVDVVAAVIGQSFAAEEATGTALLFTSVQYPFMLTNAAVTTELADGTSVAIALPVGQNCPAEAPCETTYSLLLAPGGCTLSGEYALTFELACHPAYTDDCPLQGEGGRVVFELQSQDLCAVLREDVDLSGALQAYLPDYSEARDAFLLGQTMYWQSTVASSKVAIVDSLITEVSTEFEQGGVQPLFAGGSPTGAGSLVNFALLALASPVSDRFRFDAAPLLFPVPADEFRSAVVRCSVAVTYASAAAKREVTRYARRVPLHMLGLGGHPLVQLPHVLEARALPAEKSQPLQTEARVGLSRQQAVADDGPTGPDEESSAARNPPMWPFLAAALAVCSLCFVLAGFAVRRRRQQLVDLPVYNGEQNLQAAASAAAAAVGRTNSKTMNGKLYEELLERRNA